ncbi:MAG: nucleotidyltransferase [Verrucomicrobia bacterium]|nr:nucleotidyltransferase [Verrucomicrobiota bacterium]
MTSLLDRILAACELPQDLRQKAQKHYEEKAQHLKKCPLLSQYDVVIKAQGSASIGTTVPPVTKKRGEFDVDLLIAIEAQSDQMVPNVLHKEIGAYLKIEYAKDLSRLRLGWQLDYAIEDRMHFDIVPAIRSIHPIKGRILAAPDWEKNEWKKTNPEAYTRDFLELCELLPIFDLGLIAACNSSEFSNRKQAREPKVEPACVFADEASVAACHPTYQEAP